MPEDHARSCASAPLRTALLLLLLALPAWLAPAGAHGQRLPLALEVRGGMALPMGEVTDDDPGIGAEAGPHAGGAVLWRFTPSLAAFAGYGAAWLACERCGNRGIDETVLDTGFEGGVRASLPAGGLRPWLAVGVLLHQLRFSDGESTLSSDRAPGFLVAAGLELPLAGRVALVPQLRYGSYTAELDLGDLADRSVSVARVTGDLGIAFNF